MADLSSDMLAHDGAAGGAALRGGAGSVGDYFALLKPRVMSLVMFTAFTGLVLAPGHIHPWLAAVALLCIAVGAGAAGALNMWFDADIDARMRRTARRPVPAGRILASEALGFGLTLAGGSVALLGVMVDWTAAAFLAFTIAFYVVVYTMWLKRSTPQNIVIGGAAGAFPPMVAWTAVAGTVDLASLSLFLIVFMWTPPHFWALALFRCGDYQAAGVPMLPVVAGADETRRQILLYALAMVPTAALPALFGIAGPLYGAAAALLTGLFLWHAWQVFRRRDGAAADRAAKGLFRYSVVYLFAMFASLLVERLAGVAPFPGVLS